MTSACKTKSTTWYHQLKEKDPKKYAEYLAKAKARNKERRDHLKAMRESKEVARLVNEKKERQKKLVRSFKLVRQGKLRLCADKSKNGLVFLPMDMQQSNHPRIMTDSDQAIQSAGTLESSLAQSQRKQVKLEIEDEQDSVLTSAVTLDKDIWEAMPTSTTTTTATDLAEQREHQPPSPSQSRHQSLQPSHERQPLSVKVEPPNNTESLPNSRLTATDAERKDDEFAVIGKSLAVKLRNLPRDQRIHAEKLFADVIYEAELGNLSRQSMLLARPSSEGTHVFRSQTGVPFVVSLR